MVQHPQINLSLCIGCGTCVRKCPEGNVLAVIGGKSTIINGANCRGHGKCEASCPVGAITIGLGDTSKRPDIPIVDENQQTSIPHVYVAGEVGGYALIRNAVNQGKSIIKQLQINPQLSKQKDIYDVIIVGGGPAGIAASLAATEKSLSYLLIDQQGFGGTVLQYPRKKLVLTDIIELPLYGKLSKDEYEKEELVSIWEAIYKRYNINSVLEHKLENVSPAANHTLNVEVSLTAKPEELVHFQTQNVILALGRRGTPRKLNVPGENLGKVMYNLIDASLFSNNSILVVGGGDVAIEAAVALAQQPENKVTISYRKESFFRIRKRNSILVQKMTKAGQLNIVYNSEVKEIKEKEVVLSTPEGTQNIINDFTFVFVGGIAPFDLLKKIGIKFGEEH